jgi:type I restriction enzyme, R subunit
MIKHSADYQVPILTARERVEQVVNKIIQSQSFNDEQIKWLASIKEHLMVNLAISEQDMDSFPIFGRSGGLRKARQIFGNELKILIQKINEEIAA